jgi:hypothetical protein
MAEASSNSKGRISLTRRCGSAGFVSLFAFFLESFAHLLVVGKLHPGSLLASQLTGGGASLGCRIWVMTIAVVAVPSAVISTAICTPLISAVDASNAPGC